MALARVLARGQITIPREIRERVHLEPGDLVRVETNGSDQIVIEIIPTFTLDEILEKYHSDEPVDMHRLRAEGEEDAFFEFAAGIARATGETQPTSTLPESIDTVDA